MTATTTITTAMTDDKNNDNNADNNSAFDDKICYKNNKNTMTAMTIISMKMMSTKKMTTIKMTTETTASTSTVSFALFFSTFSFTLYDAYSHSYKRVCLSVIPSASLSMI